MVLLHIFLFASAVLLAGCSEAPLAANPASSAPAAAAPAGPPQEGSIERQLFEALNRERRERALEELRWDARLARAARKHSEQMADRGELTHQFPGEEPVRSRIAAEGVRFTASAENVGFASTVERVHGGWMSSPGHRANILNEKYNAVGIGVAMRGRYIYATQNLARVLVEHDESSIRRGIVEAMQQLRRDRRLPPLRVEMIPELDAGACRGESNASDIPGRFRAQRRIVTFTISDPEKLPAHMQRRTLDPTVKEAHVGACFAPSEKYGNGNFWAMVVFLY